MALMDWSRVPGMAHFLPSGPALTEAESADRPMGALVRSNRHGVQG